jgi:hypothetical protein
MPLPKPKRSTVVLEFGDRYDPERGFGRVLSEWSGDPADPDVLVYEKHAIHKYHFHIMMNGWGIAEEIFERLREMGVEKIRIKARPFKDSEHENEVWEISMHDALKKKCSTVHQYEDYEPQRFIFQECMFDPRERFF